MTQTVTVNFSAPDMHEASVANRKRAFGRDVRVPKQDLHAASTTNRRQRFSRHHSEAVRSRTALLQTR